MNAKMLGELVGMIVTGYSKTRSVHTLSLLVDPLFTFITKFGQQVPQTLVSNLTDAAHARVFLVRVCSGFDLLSLR